MNELLLIGSVVLILEQLFLHISYSERPDCSVCPQ